MATIATLMIVLGVVIVIGALGLMALGWIIAAVRDEVRHHES